MTAVPTPTTYDPSARTSLLLSPQQLDKPWHHALIWLAGIVGSLLLRVFFRWRVEGLENVPAKGPLLITVNHLSVMDVPAMGTALIRRGWEPGVSMFTASKEELFEKRLLPRVMALLGMFPVHRNQADVNAMRTMLMIIRRGGLLGLAAEGTRSPTGHLQLFQPGVAKLAIQRRLPIVPAAVSGVENVLPIGAKIPRFVPITVRFGPLYELSKYYDVPLTNEVLEEAAWEMRSHVAALLPEWMRTLPPEDSQVRFGGVRSRQAEVM